MKYDLLFPIHINMAISIPIWKSMSCDDSLTLGMTQLTNSASPNKHNAFIVSIVAL